MQENIAEQIQQIMELENLEEASFERILGIQLTQVVVMLQENVVRKEK